MSEKMPYWQSARTIVNESISEFLNREGITEDEKKLFINLQDSLDFNEDWVTMQSFIDLIKNIRECDAIAEGKSFSEECTLRFLPPGIGVMCNEEGNIVLCSCGKPAGSGAMGKHTLAVWCNDCSPLNQSPSKLIYRNINEE